ncbi:HNH endonuclease signature motif containing protein, partial [Arthrobacter sp. SAFR-179]|uniref:HNH endonuclease signature motif containing protein n=1 Tax=Arthrobacter sp. SAFR-179 TaxID=3387279 RepID=UPI003F7C9ED6
GKCTFPGCSNHTPDNDTDHLTAWEHAGRTDVRNLAQLCPKHHRLKHARPWIPDPATHNGPPGWTSPTGRHYKPEHPDHEPTQWPPGIMPVSAGTPCMEACPDDLPQWEPDDDQLIDLNDLSPEDPVWAEFFTKPFVLSG